jgi:hypothetical protein
MVTIESLCQSTWLKQDTAMIVRSAEQWLDIAVVNRLIRTQRLLVNVNRHCLSRRLNQRSFLTCCFKIRTASIHWLTIEHTSSIELPSPINSEPCSSAYSLNCSMIVFIDEHTHEHTESMICESRAVGIKWQSSCQFYLDERQVNISIYVFKKNCDEHVFLFFVWFHVCVCCLSIDRPYAC